MKGAAAVTTIISSSWMLPKEHCWVEVLSETSPVIFLPAEIVTAEVSNDTAVVHMLDSGIQSRISKHLIYQKNKEVLPRGWDDMVSMNVLNDAEILQNIKRRFSQDEIFTYIGPTLVVMNPYKLITRSFNESILQLFHQAISRGSLVASPPLPPHVYALASDAYLQLFSNGKNQAIIISGESGAGKTENAKYAMQFLTSLSSQSGKHQQNDHSMKLSETPIEEKILRCNPILEAFGNAKTVRNNNSSRFGKYVRILIDKPTKQIRGAEMQSYLLEKSRVTILNDGERNYHIFYAFLAGESPTEISRLGLSRDPQHYRYLNQSSSIKVDGIHDAEDFKEVKQAMSKLNFAAHEETAIIDFIAVILSLGNLSFDATKLDDRNPCEIEDISIIRRVAQILSVDAEELISSIVNKRRIITGTKVKKDKLAH